MSGSIPTLGDKQDQIVELLKIIAQNAGGLDARTGGESLDQSQTFHINEGGGESGEEPLYYTSGVGGVAVDNDEWEDVTLGFRARTINLRFDAPIDVAFRNPNERGSWQIPLAPDESPFTIGGDTPIRADELWLKRSVSEDEEGNEIVPTVHFIAMR